MGICKETHMFGKGSVVLGGEKTATKIINSNSFGVIRRERETGKRYLKTRKDEQFRRGE